MTSSFDRVRFQALASARSLRLGQPIVSVRSTASTNDLALDAARSGGAHGATFVADEQTHGRGRHGRSWLSAPGESLLVSILLRPRLPLSHAVALPLAVGLGVRKVVATLVGSNLATELKWPNDVLVSGKKISGVLVESQIRGAELEAAVVGIGLNMGCLSFPPELSEQATSLALLGAEGLQREAVLVELLSALDDYLRRIEDQGVAALSAELERHDALRGCQLSVDGLVGRASGIDSTGRLLLIDEQGEAHALAAGHVVILERASQSSDL
ncbi:MAG TPA: biotin--[acetyl-CoA-carboxylase] ligase [Polyangiaceae bacterium]|nr:biotin--[acetyl-CoA-carboxylase] ligase [Polyangiaceae bacterium]